MVRYRGRHLRPVPKRRGPAVFGTAAALWAAGPAANAATHLVGRGETLSGIAARYGTTPDRLAAANNLSDPNFIVAGRRLRIPVRLTMNGTHTVRAGETLSDIASRLGTSIGALARANKLSNPNFIIAGQQLRVPGVSTTPVSAPQSSAPAPASTETVAALLERHAVGHGVDPSLVKAVAYHESGWQQDVVSVAGAVGVMQVMPDTQDFVNNVLGGHALDIRNADDNVHAGVMYLRHLLSIIPSEKRALAAYYSGPGSLGHRLDAGQRAYVASVQALKARF